jgi:hypothetical protein
MTKETIKINTTKECYGCVFYDAEWDDCENKDHSGYHGDCNTERNVKHEYIHYKPCMCRVTSEDMNRIFNQFVKDNPDEIEYVS